MATFLNFDFLSSTFLKFFLFFLFFLAIHEIILMEKKINNKKRAAQLKKINNSWEEIQDIYNIYFLKYQNFRKNFDINLLDPEIVKRINKKIRRGKYLIFLYNNANYIENKKNIIDDMKDVVNELIYLYDRYVTNVIKAKKNESKKFIKKSKVNYQTKTENNKNRKLNLKNSTKEIKKTTKKNIRKLSL